MLYCSGSVHIKNCRTKFADLPSAGIWKDRTETDEELLSGSWNISDDFEIDWDGG